jgi:hypothetical protein
MKDSVWWLLILSRPYRSQKKVRKFTRTQEEWGAEKKCPIPQIVENLPSLLFTEE